MKNVKQDFPIFKNHPDLVYLDSSATSQKPQTVIDAVAKFYEFSNSNIHRGIYDLSQNATEMFEDVRRKVAGFIGAFSEKEIIFTSSTTESINLAAFGYAKKFLKSGDIVIISEMEHHSNIVPWQKLREEIGVELVFLPIVNDWRLDYHALDSRFRGNDKRGGNDKGKIKFIALAHISNVLGTINPLDEIIPYFRKLAPQAKILIDAAQSIPHIAIDVKKLDCDFLAFSSHKMLGPSGVGVLFAKKELLEKMDPLLVGSHMIKKVTKENSTWADVPEKFEPGTRNIEGVIGLGAAIDYLQKIGMENIENYEKELTAYALEKLNNIKQVKIFGPKIAKNRIGVFSFVIGNIHAHDVAEILNRSQIAVRSGHHCAQVLMECLGVAGTTRASFYLYNTKSDIDKLFEGIEKLKDIFRIM